MKKHQFLLLILIFCSYQAFSQNSKWSVGIEGGPGLRNFRSKDHHTNYFYKKNPYHLNYTFGDFIEYHIKGKFSLKADFLFEKKGGRAYMPTIFAIAMPIKVLLNTNYLSIPVLAKFSFGRKVKFFVNVGPYVGFFLGLGTRHYGLAYGALSSSSIKPFDLGLTTGMGLTVPLNEHIFINTEIRNNLGLYDVVKDEYGYPQKNITFNLLTGLGYRF